MPDAGYVHRVHIGHDQRGAAGRKLTARSVVGSVLSGVAQQALGEGVGLWINLSAKNDSDVYVPLLFKGDDDVYRNLTGKDR